MAMNKAKYDGLAPDLKKVIDANSGSATSGWLGKTQQGNDPIGRKSATDRNNTIHTFTAEQAQEFTKLSRRSTTSGSPTWTSGASRARH
jgi:TRAP-type C4-dicarboxylate transport system substrate-binding protein